MSPVAAAEIVRSSGFPPKGGQDLALRMLESVPPPWDEREVELRGSPPEMLIGPFFFAFLQTVHEVRPELLATARKIRWLLDHDFQRENVADWMRTFRPTEVQDAKR